MVRDLDNFPEKSDEKEKELQPCDTEGNWDFLQDCWLIATDQIFHTQGNMVME